MNDQSSAAKDAAAKERIISHMNADHHDSVVRYLEHYHNIPSFLAYGGRITDVTLDRVTFACRGHTYDTPLKPAMTSYREARERLVDMDKQCVHALGRSDITVREYTVPRGFHLALFVTVCVTLVAFSRKSNFAPSGLIASLVPGAFRRFCSIIQPFLFYGMLALHGAEAIHMGRGRLSKHNVNIRSPVYWLWTADCFVEGVGAYHRFDKMIVQKRVEKQKQKH